MYQVVHLNENQIFLMVFVCAENFFVCAPLDQMLFKKQIFKGIRPQEV